MDVNCTNKADIGRVSRSLNRSKVRKKLHRHLCAIYPGDQSAKELATFTNTTLANVYGALAGDGRNYCLEDSLINMEIAERVLVILEGKTVDRFRATEYGLDIQDDIDDYSQRSGFDKSRSETAGKLGVKA